METFSALLAICEGKPNGDQRPYKDQWSRTLMFFFCAEQTVEQTTETPVIWDAIVPIVTLL